MTWNSSSPTVASISTSGIASTLATGSSTITASSGSVTSNNATLTVTPATLTAIAIKPASATIAKGLTSNLTATGTYSDGSIGNITSSAVWAIADPTIASFNSSTGLATGIGQGSTTVTASTGNFTSNSATLTVTAPVLTGIAITPANGIVAKGLSSNLSATGTYSDGSTSNLTSSVVWALSNPAVVSINSSTGVVTGLNNGNATITATQNGIISPAATLNVTDALITGITITPANVTVVKGLTSNLTATASYSDGSSGNISDSVTWVSSSPTVASISTSGVAAALATGSTLVTAKSGSITSLPVTLNVSPASLTGITVSPNVHTATIGTPVIYSATGSYSDGSTNSITNLVTWNSSSSVVATIDASGTATPLTVGLSNVSATSNSINSNNATLNVISHYATANLVIGKVVTANTNTQAGDPQSIVTSSGSWCSYQGGLTNSLSFQIDLQSVYTIGRMDFAPSQTQTRTVSTSVDGVSWVQRYNNALPLVLNSPTLGASFSVLADGAYTARYIQYTGATNYPMYVCMASVGVYKWIP